MPNDLELIKQLEEEIAAELTDKAIGVHDTNMQAYQADSNGHVIRLGLQKLQLEEFPRTIPKFTNLDYLSLYANQLSELPREITQHG